MRKDVERYSVEFEAPDVEVHCLHGYGVDTVSRLVYKPGAFPDQDPDFLYGDGDGTVNIHSLEGCLSWQGKQEKKVYHQTFSSLDHMGILRDKRVRDYLVSLITKL
ncbi:hypothetical protein Cfor_09004 [Coptotermes formosanus]|uniref:Uncharacterized protein n=1 Tax=Coptotermes formosanus TaxID=36987 RepID=A0A6L2QD04_COPFO|nr:hypothetical protein Cfor_09004 [Coptotermes formosanus]